jgi:hypothetical protein
VGQRLRPHLDLHALGPPDLLPGPQDIRIMLEGETDRLIQGEIARLDSFGDVPFEGRFYRERNGSGAKKQAGD